MKLRVLILFCFVYAFSGFLAALEPEELRPGMDELAAYSVYTQHRSCSNVPIEEWQDGMAWAAQLYGREARVELGLKAGRVVKVSFGFGLAQGEDGRELWELLRSARTAELGEPAELTARRIGWKAKAWSCSLELVEEGRGRQILLSFAERAGRD